MSDVTGPRPRRNPRLASRSYEGEVVIVDPDQNVVRMLNPVGSRIWELADGTHTTGKIATLLVEEFDVTYERAEQAVRDFVAELNRKGLLVSAGDGEAT